MYNLAFMKIEYHWNRKYCKLRIGRSSLRDLKESAFLVGARNSYFGRGFRST